MNLYRIGTLVALFSLVGCAHATMRGSVAMKDSNSEAHICMGDNEVKANDRVVLFKNVCTATRGSPKSGGSEADCKKVRLGEGTVLRTLNEHYSIVKVDSGVTFEEGTIVEKE